MSAQEAVGDERLSLTMRTSWLSEFRTATGVLAMFEIAGNCTTFGRLCATIAQLPGIEFADLRVPVKFTGPVRFRFKGKDYEMSLSHSDYRIVAADRTSASNATELLRHLKQMLVRRRAFPSEKARSR
jgi:hypothetical protein